MIVRNAKRWCVIIALAGLVGLAFSTVATAEMLLTHLYKFDSDLSDSVGTIDAINLDTDAHVDTSVSSPVGLGALALDGDDDRLLVPDASVLPAGPFTLSWWAYLVDPQLSTSSSYYFSSGSGAISVFNLRAHIGDRLDGRISINFGNGPTPVLDGWSHHVVTWTAEGQGLWYRNGVLVNDTTADANGPKPFAGLPTGDSEGLVMGNYRSSFDRYALRGYMDDVQIYTGTCTQADAQYLYENPGETLPVPEPGVLVLFISVALGLSVRRFR